MIDELATQELDDDLSDDLDAVDTVDEADDDDAFDPESTVVRESANSTDNVGDPSVEINVEELIHDLEADGLIGELENEHNTRKRLEELMERKRARGDLEDFDDYDV